MNLTSQKLKSILPNCKTPDIWSQLLNTVPQQYGIDEISDICNLIAQIGHESAHFNSLVENLNYSSGGLLKVFPKYFGNPPKADAVAYARKPEKIANLVYANRMGNGPESSGDGWNYRGRGLLQLTGKSNYTQCSLSLFGDTRLLETPDLLIDPEYALRSAMWFWVSNDLNKIKDFTQLTKRINGGTHGLQDREIILARAQLALLT